MAPRYRITLTQEEREMLEAVTRCGKTKAPKLIHARALLLCDAGPHGSSVPWKVAPDRPACRSLRRRLEESIDLYPTLMDLYKPEFTRTQEPLDGRSLRPLMDGSATSVSNASVSYRTKAVSITTNTHRLIATHNAGKWSGTELYNLRETPDPLVNLADKQPDVVKRMLDLMPPFAEGKRPPSE